MVALPHDNEVCDCAYCVAVQTIAETTMELAKIGIDPDIITLAILKAGLELTYDVPTVSRMIKAIGRIYIDERKIKEKLDKEMEKGK